MNPPPVPVAKAPTAPPPVPVIPGNRGMVPPPPPAVPPVMAPRASAEEDDMPHAVDNSVAELLAETAAEPSPMPMELVADEPAPEEVDPRTPLPEGTELGEYTITGRLGQGGFGITYRARHTKEGTIVVIKEHMPKGLAVREPDSLFVCSSSPESEEHLRATMDEFIEEMVVMRGLEHPGIVPILASFEANGTAYYVMPFLQGKSLEPDEHPTLDKVSRRREARTIRQQLFSMLDTLEYMEQHNIVHRDIKPENIMQTSEDGRLILLDFGSARQLQMGKVFTNIYTPDFCAPEQAMSASDSEMSSKLGMWTDIYSLGATFHFLITRLMPPRAEMRGYAEQDPYKPLASRPDLVRIYGSPFLQGIDRAMELRPRDRWRSASAWRDSITQGIIPPPPRLLQRMRLVVAGSLVIMAVLGGISLWAIRERNQAIEIYNQSLHFTEGILYDFNEELTDVPGATGLQSQLVTQLKNYLDGMEQLSVGDDEKVQRALSSAWRNLGYVYTERGNLEASTDALQRAMELQSALVESYPDNLRYRYDMARTWLYRAEVARRRNNNSTATSLVSQAMMTLRELCAKAPGNPDYQCMLGRAMELTASLASAAGNEELHRKAVAELLSLYRAQSSIYPQNVEIRLGLGYALQSAGYLAMDTENFAAAGNCFNEARQIFADLTNTNPYRLSFRKGLASAVFSIASLNSRMGASVQDEKEHARYSAQALADYTRHLELVQELSTLDPANAEYVFLQCRTMGLMVDILLSTDNNNQAEAYSNAILEKINVLMETAPDNVEYALLKATGLRGLARAHSRSERHREKADNEFEEARLILEKLLNQTPDNRSMQLMYMNILSESATHAALEGGTDDARQWLQRALFMMKKLMRSSPKNSQLPWRMNKMQEQLDNLPEEKEAPEQK